MVDEGIAATPRAPASARAALRRRSWARLGEEGLEQLVLVTSELVTNTILHGGLDEGRHIRLRVEQQAERVRVEVEDEGRGFRLGIDRRGGEARGLAIVAGLADRWGLESPGPTIVWAELREPPAPARVAHLRIVPREDG